MKPLRMSCLLLITLVLSFAFGCGAAKPAALTLEKDFGISVKGMWFPIYQDAAPLRKALGDDYELFAAPSCLYEGEDKEFAFRSCSLFTNPDGEKDVWYLLDIKDGTLSTARGITVGSTKDALVAAYGETYYWESDYQMTYSISGVKGDLSSPCIIFDLADEQVSKISVYYPTNAD